MNDKKPNECKCCRYQINLTPCPDIPCCPCPGPRGRRVSPVRRGRRVSPVRRGQQGEPGVAPDDIFASFATFEVRFVNAQPIPLGTSLADPTGNITLADATRIVLTPGYYYISYSVSAVLDEAGYMQITPSYNGASHIEYGIYFKTNVSSSSAYGSNSIIIYVPEETSFTLTYNSNTANRSGAATVAVLKLNRTV